MPNSKRDGSRALARLLSSGIDDAFAEAQVRKVKLPPQRGYIPGEHHATALDVLRDRVVGESQLGLRLYDSLVQTHTTKA